MAATPDHFIHHEASISPPYPETREQTNPTLLVSWWCTIFAAVIIMIRLGGRWVRTERLFLEDKVIALSIIPLFARMACVHVILKVGTNNVFTDGLTAEQIAGRELGSKLVLAARVFYALFIWIAKLTIADFLHRIYSQMWTKKHDMGLTAIKYFLLLTFIGVFVSTLAECQPFDHYWQVVPDPGPSCRTSYVQLLTMGICDGITDLILVIFPLPIIFNSTMKLERKISLSLLFSMSLILVGITIYRVQATVAHHYEQRFRSLLASFEILAATGVANAIVLGSFLRDRGAKKNKFKASSSGNGGTGVGSVVDRPSVLSSACGPQCPARIATATTTRSTQAHIRGIHSWGSDVDLVGDMAMRLGPEFHIDRPPRVARPAPAVHSLPLVPLSKDGRAIQRSDFADAGDVEGVVGASGRNRGMNFDDLESEPGSPTSPMTPMGMNFFDVGGLLDEEPKNGAAVGGGANSAGEVPRQRERRRSSVSFAPLPSANSFAPLIPPEYQRSNSPASSFMNSPGRTRPSTSRQTPVRKGQAVDKHNEEGATTPGAEDEEKDNSLFEKLQVSAVNSTSASSSLSDLKKR